jgi:type 1 glutamine amidotransferase
MVAACLAALMISAPIAPLKVLVFSKTAAFRHDSIPDGKRAIFQIGQAKGWTTSFSENSKDFSAAKLKRFDVVVFLSTTGDVLDSEQQTAFEYFIRSGKGYVGIHAAADTEYEWPWYGKLVGAYFKSHPRIQEAEVKIEDKNHPATLPLPGIWRRTDEWYDYRTNPRANVHVLASLVASSYADHTMGADHPIMWCHEFDGGRAFYTGFGHTKESYADPLFRNVLQRAIEWAGKSANSAKNMRYDSH